jgi:hypothetical protein
MPDVQRFPFVEARDGFGDIDVVPRLPLRLCYGDRQLEASGLLDTGASASVLPYSIGRDLGAIWQNQTLSVQLAGNLAPVEARGLALLCHVGDFPPVRLVFAWSQTDDVPLLLGRMNFFAEFDVCFYRSRLLFEVRQKELVALPTSSNPVIVN